MSSRNPRASVALRIFAAVIGVTLLVCMVRRTDPARLLQNPRTVIWGILLVIALAGIAHLVKTVVWRLTLLNEAKRVPFWRTLGLRLASEAMGQFGFVGLVCGESTRVALLGPGVPMANAISSVTLDRALFMGTSAMVTVAGLAVATVVAAVSSALRIYAAVAVFVVVGFLAITVLAVGRRWPLFSGTARAAAAVPWFRSWLMGKKSVVESAEHQFLEFHRQAPGAFWACLCLNVLTQFLAVTEVYLILHLLGAHVTFVDALILESLTKLISVIGVINPGNVGTYEGGNMVIGKFVGLSGAQGLTLGLCRRLRALFWGAVGGICLAWLSRSDRHASPDPQQQSHTDVQGAPLEEQRAPKSQSGSGTTIAIILANDLTCLGWFEPIRARVGTLPVLLRVILGVQSTYPERIVVVLDHATGSQIKLDLSRTRRLPNSIEWKEVAPGASLSSILRMVLATGGRARVLLAFGDRTYQPILHRMASDWDGDGALEVATGSEPAGLFGLSGKAALELADDFASNIVTPQDLHRWMAGKTIAEGAGFLDFEVVEENSWQRISNSVDRNVAEEKLDRWLVKPTDGIFARMNRTISIPISRQLIRFPITPNMVSLFTLGVSFAAGAFFALGGYWATIFGAILSVWASILDGCDGEVARLKLQASDFGCWLETVCDYLYYVIIFAGMAIGLTRSNGNPAYLVWGGVLLVGAATTFLVSGMERQRLSGAHPEQFLAVWQKKAENHLSNPLLFVGRYTEFIIRRCFLPYALLVLAVLNLTWLALCMSAVGANLAWFIGLSSRFALSSRGGAVKGTTVIREQQSL